MTARSRMQMRAHHGRRSAFQQSPADASCRFGVALLALDRVCVCVCVCPCRPLIRPLTRWFYGSALERPLDSVWDASTRGEQKKGCSRNSVDQRWTVMLCSDWPLPFHLEESNVVCSNVPLIDFQRPRGQKGLLFGPWFDSWANHGLAKRRRVQVVLWSLSRPWRCHLLARAWLVIGKTRPMGRRNPTRAERFHPISKRRLLCGGCAEALMNATHTHTLKNKSRTPLNRSQRANRSNGVQGEDDRPWLGSQLAPPPLALPPADVLQSNNAHKRPSRTTWLAQLNPLKTIRRVSFCFPIRYKLGTTR